MVRSISISISGRLTAVHLWPCLRNVRLRGIMELIGLFGNSVHWEDSAQRHSVLIASLFYSFLEQKFVMALDDLTIVGDGHK